MSMLANAKSDKSPKDATGRVRRPGPNVSAPYPGRPSSAKAERESAEVVVVKKPGESREDRRTEGHGTGEGPERVNERSRKVEAPPRHPRPARWIPGEGWTRRISDPP